MATGKAKGVQARSAVLIGLSPTVADEIERALENLRGTHKAAAVAAWAFGWSKSTWYDRTEHPLTLTVGELLVLIAKVAEADPQFVSRLCGHLQALDSHAAITARAAADTYRRAHELQRGLFEDRR